MFGWRHAAATYVVYAAGVVAATWPLALNPAGLWPPHHDARVFTWVMASMARRLVSDPLRLFHGNAFYPFGESLAYTEMLLPPALLGLPGFLWGDPVLTYNLLLLGLWPLNGLAMAWVAYRLTASRPAALLAGTIFCLSPYFSEYYFEFQMLLAALLPIVMFAWVRWLEFRDRRWLALAFGGLTVQGLTSWYYAIILAVGLGTLGLGFVLLRWRGWTWRDLVALGAGGAAVLLALQPFALPYLTIRTELGYERDIPETARHSADLFTFLEPAGRSLLYRWLPFMPDGGAETSAFIGLVALALVVASVAWLRDDRARLRTSLRRGMLVALLVTLALVAWACVTPHVRLPLGPLVVRPRAAELVYVVGALGLALLGARGWALARLDGERRLSPGDWVRLLTLLVAVSLVLALGPVMHVGRQPVGTGPYVALYHVALPLHALRVTTRFAILTVAGLALLAAFGLARLEARWRARPYRRRALLAVVFAAVGLEYAVAPAHYAAVDAAPRAVDRAVRADPDDAAVLEWPLGVMMTDADAMFRSLGHEKRLVNGLAGYVPEMLYHLSDVLGHRGPQFPVAEAQAALRRIYPLRYLIIRMDHPGRAARAAWHRLRRAPPPLFRFHGTFGSADLYEIVPLPERGSVVERLVSYDFLRGHPVLRVALRPLTVEPGVQQWVDLRLNGRPLQSVPLTEPITVSRALDSPLHRAAPNLIVVTHRYRRPDTVLDDRYGVGATGVRIPVDLRIRSGGEPWGSLASIQVNGVDYAINRRGYNLVALDPSGEVRDATAFDTFADAGAAGRLATWIAALPARSLVAGAVKDEASDRLDAAAVEALATLGVAGDLRGRFRESHGFIGVKGRAPGSALESLGPHPVELTVGRPDPGLGLELTEFRLLAEPVPGSLQ